MSSTKKPPLPSWSIIEKRPELFCLNYSNTKKMCDVHNSERDSCNTQSWNNFRKKFTEWKSNL